MKQVSEAHVDAVLRVQNPNIVDDLHRDNPRATWIDKLPN
jgi:hypothetical protein